MVRRFQVARHLSKWRNTRLRCDCMGYWFPHRRGGGNCEHSARPDFYMVLRGGGSLAEAQQMLTADQLDQMFPLPPQPETNDADIPF